MLKGVPKIISPELLKVLAEMGHGDEIIFSDAHFPAYSFARPVLRCDAVSSSELLSAALCLLELDQYVDCPVTMMSPVKGDSLDEAFLADCRTALKQDASRIEFIDRFAFYERAKRVYAVVVTGETRKYGNILIKKGVIGQ